jgi:hypothetical protein
MCGCVHETKDLKPRGSSALVITIALSILLRAMSGRNPLPPAH